MSGANPIKPSGEFKPLLEEDEMVVGFKKCRICSTYYPRNYEEESQHLAWHHDRLFTLTAPSITYFYDIEEVIKCLARRNWTKTKIEEKVRQHGILSSPKDLRGYSCDICKRLDTSDENIFLSHMKNVCRVTMKERMNHIINFCRGCQGRFPSREMLEAHIAAGPCWPPMTVINRLYNEVKPEVRHITADIIEMCVKQESSSVSDRLSAGGEQEEISLSSLTPEPRLPRHTKTLQRHHLTELAPPPLSHTQLPRPVPAWNLLSQILHPVPHFSHPPPTIQPSVPQSSQSQTTFQHVPQFSQPLLTKRPNNVLQIHQSPSICPGSPPHLKRLASHSELQSEPSETEPSPAFSPISGKKKKSQFAPPLPEGPLPSPSNLFSSPEKSVRERSPSPEEVEQTTQSPPGEEVRVLSLLHLLSILSFNQQLLPFNEQIAKVKERAVTMESERFRSSQEMVDQEECFTLMDQAMETLKLKLSEKKVTKQEMPAVKVAIQQISHLISQSSRERSDVLELESQAPAQSQDSKLLRLSIAKTIQRKLRARARPVSGLELNSLVEAEYQRVLHKIPRPSHKPSAPAPVPSSLSSTWELPPTRESRKTLSDPRLSRQNYTDGSHEMRRIIRLARSQEIKLQHLDSDIECLKDNC